MSTRIVFVELIVTIGLKPMDVQVISQVTVKHLEGLQITAKPLVITVVVGPYYNTFRLSI